MLVNSWSELYWTLPLPCQCNEDLKTTEVNLDQQSHDQTIELPFLCLLKSALQYIAVITRRKCRPALIITKYLSAASVYHY